MIHILVLYSDMAYDFIVQVMIKEMRNALCSNTELCSVVVYFDLNENGNLQKFIIMHFVLIHAKRKSLLCSYLHQVSGDVHC